jgi:hypothetical protein
MSDIAQRRPDFLRPGFLLDAMDLQLHVIGFQTL